MPSDTFVTAASTSATQKSTVHLGGPSSSPLGGAATATTSRGTGW